MRSDFTPITWGYSQTPCPRCGVTVSWSWETSSANKALDSHYANACPTMYQERMLTAFLDRLEGILNGYKP